MPTNVPVNLVGALRSSVRAGQWPRNETLRFELDWFKNPDGYALNRDESYCFDAQ